MQIRKPTNLISDTLIDESGNYCSVGWVLHELGMSDDELFIINDMYIDELLPHMGRYLPTSVSEYDIAYLTTENDEVNTYEERLAVLYEFCAKHGIEVV